MAAIHSPFADRTSSMPESHTARNKRIAKNTLYLYIRTIVVMAISLYTSRVILKALGATDFGIFNLVGSAVVLFTFINSAMTSSTQRFLNVSIGRNESKEITKVFTTSGLIHLIIVGIFLVLAETIGLWFVTKELNIPAERENAAFWVYQITVLNTCLNTVRCPLSASIIAYERMDYFARISIVEAALKLGISFAILYATVDRLILYSFLLLLTGILITVWNAVFCHNNFESIRITRHIDKPTIKSMMGFSLWSLMGSGSLMASNQGINMLLNISYNVIVNAALGIAYQVNTAASTLVSNFQTAFMPQITKSFASNETSYLHKLIYTTSRYSFLLSFVISYPIFINCEPILRIWLSNYPEFTPGLVRVIIICVGFDALSGPLWMAAHAKGKIRNYQLAVSILLLTMLLACYIAVEMGYSPVIAFGSRIVVLVLLYFYRILYTKKAVGLAISDYVKKVMGRCALTIAASVPITFLMPYITTSTLWMILLDCVYALFIVIFCGLNSAERAMLVVWSKKVTQRFVR